jgi:hypothetical protein
MTTGILHSTAASVTNGATWEFLYKRDSAGYGDDVIFCKEDVCEMRDLSGNLSIALYTDTWTWLDTGYNVSTGTVYHVVATYDGSRIKVYVNGDIEYNEVKTGGTLNYNDYPYKLNSRGTPEGTISSAGNHTFYVFRIYSRDLKSSEVRHLSNEVRTQFGEI